MGLYIAKMLAENCINGDLNVRNTTKGAQFILSCEVNYEI